MFACYRMDRTYYACGILRKRRIRRNTIRRLLGYTRRKIQRISRTHKKSLRANSIQSCRKKSKVNPTNKVVFFTVFRFLVFLSLFAYKSRCSVLERCICCWLRKLSTNFFWTYFQTATFVIGFLSLQLF